MSTARVVPYLTSMIEDDPQREYLLREVFNVLRGMVRSGSPWRKTPTAFRPILSAINKCNGGLKMMVSDNHLAEIMPNLSSAKRALYMPFLQQALEEFEINTPLRSAAFLAQVAHESAEFRFMEEIWGPSAAQRRYDPVTRISQALGNTKSGDGKRFKGRGPIQITGRDNYKRYGDLLHVDLISDPSLAALPEVGFRTAGLYWKRNGLNELADKQWFKTITKRINPGLKGLEDRTRYYIRAKRILGVATRGTEEDYAPDDPGDDSGLPIFTRGSEENH